MITPKKCEVRWGYPHSVCDSPPKYRLKDLDGSSFWVCLHHKDHVDALPESTWRVVDKVFVIPFSDHGELRQGDLIFDFPGSPVGNVQVTEVGEISSRVHPYKGIYVGYYPTECILRWRDKSWDMMKKKGVTPEILGDAMFPELRGVNRVEAEKRFEETYLGITK